MSKNTVSLEDIHRAVWRACDTFRGVIDATDYKDYILVMLFLKYISDVWAERKEMLEREYENNPERVKILLGLERFVLPDGASFYDLYDNRNDIDIGDRINKAFAAIEAKNRASLEDIFSVDFNSERELGETKERNALLKQLLEDFNRPELDLRPSKVDRDIIGDAYIYLIERFATDAGKKAGEFFTPRKISWLVAKLCNPQPGALICDPACGSGGLLLQAAKSISNQDYALHGMENIYKTWALCRMNMFLHGVDSARIERCDTLRNPKLIDRDRLIKYDNIVANPPYSLDVWGANEAKTDIHGRFWRGIPPKSRGDYAFIMHMLEVAKPKHGRITVVVSHGVLFRGGSEKRIRQKIIEENLVDTVIGLPANLFTTTSIPVAIVIFDRAREPGGAREHERDVLFIDASSEYTSSKNQNTLEDAHIMKILNAYRARRDIDRYAYLAPPEEIIKNDFNLSISRYVNTFEDEEEIDILAIDRQISQLESELSDLRAEMKYLLDGMLMGEEKSSEPR
ncbi:type I restriction-modification system subunit M [Thioalkalivibrio sp. HK1]|uniref:type I restriction-modification system subunit M n=1 Tax=Thioalkalivibrio sp. HK1 TaxID=1469245 RepID=UPI00057124F1|nr:type I restriction-modification system subunit M [Thioalkalivibrio sp. HK1]